MSLKLQKYILDWQSIFVSVKYEDKLSKSNFAKSHLNIQNKRLEMIKEGTDQGWPVNLKSTVHSNNLKLGNNLRQ